MRVLKSRGGLTRGRGKTDSVIATWIHSMHACASIHDVMIEFTQNQQKGSEQHVELDESRLKRDQADLTKLKDCLARNNPFNKEEPFLHSDAVSKILE